MKSLILAMQLWTSYDVQGLNKARVPLEGMFRSCQMEDLGGDYEELVWAEYADRRGTKFLWEFHAYKNTFGLYLRPQPEDHDRTHSAPGNRMLPENVVTFTDQRRAYTLWEAKLRITVASLNEDRQECERFYISIINMKEGK